MEKTAQNTSGAPRRRRRRRGSGSGAAQAASTPQETTKATQQAAPSKPSRGQAPRKEGKETPSGGRNRHRGSQNEAAPQQPSSRRGRNGGGQAPNREPAHNTKPAQRPARQRHTAEEEPGLELIARRPPKQKFANFEEYLAAHGGMTVPLPEENPADAPAAVPSGVTE